MNPTTGPTSDEAPRGRSSRLPGVSSDDAPSGQRSVLSMREPAPAEPVQSRHSSLPAVPLASLDFALLRGALEEIPFGVATTRSGEILYANAALERIYGAPSGGFEHKHVAVLFDQETFLRISSLLDEKRVFDGRIKAYGIDGRLVDAEVHAEWYSSEALGIGGFLVFRDVSLELGALGRLVDQLGGALFRLRTADGSLEYVSPSVAKLTGIEPATCIEHPVLLTNLVSAEERERVLFLFKRVAAGEIASATAQVSLRRPDGRTRVLHIRATGRRDTAGTVRHIDGVVTDAMREGKAAPSRSINRRCRTCARLRGGATARTWRPRSWSSRKSSCARPRSTSTRSGAPSASRSSRSALRPRRPRSSARSPIGST